MQGSPRHSAHTLILGSDHAPISLHLSYTERRGCRQFRFEDMWFEKDECHDIIRSAWQVGGSVTRVAALKPKLDRCRADLTEWSSKEFKHNLVEIGMVKHSLRHLATLSDQLAEPEEERALKSRLHALWKRE